MATIKTFAAIRPAEEFVSQIAALPYDVYNREEARKVVKANPLSFLKIDRPETSFPQDYDMYAKEVYLKAKELLDKDIRDGHYIKDTKPVYYIYELIMNGRSQTGIVACASIDDYLNNVIMKHENTREEKEQDRINHVDYCNAQTGPIFLAYRSIKAINIVVDRIKKNNPLYAFTSDDNVTHNVWVINEERDLEVIKTEFQNIDKIYIADGHHRAASAVKVGLKRRKENPNFTGKEEFNFFLSVLFPDDQLKILSYNRVIKDLNGFTIPEFLKKLGNICSIEKCEGAFEPEEKAQFGMYLDNIWYKLNVKEEYISEDPVDGLDVSILQKNVLGPILGIEDPRTDDRIDFVGGIRGLSELEKRVSEDMQVAFSMYPTSISELLNVADNKMLMPPKSTWFEPKLRSGIFIHEL